MSAPELGEAVLSAAAERAGELWGSRLVAAYALGSLAHGGFSGLVSDVDLGLVLEGPLAAGDAEHVAALSAGVGETGLPLADRLSVFWASVDVLGSREEAGRFPPLDRLDLKLHGRLLRGRDVRDVVRAPEHRELVLAAARMVVGLVERPAYQEAFANPLSLLAAGPKPLTKTILFPVRFLFTARTGEIGRNHAAVEHFVAHEPGPPADLAGAALRWRDEPPTAGDSGAAALIGAGLRGIYRTCLADHAEIVRGYGLPDLERQLNEAQSALDG